jgi:amidase
MPVRPPTIEELRDIATSFGLRLSDADLASFRGLIVPLLESYRTVEQLAEPALLAPKYPRSGGRRPSPEENPLNAWYWRCEIGGRRTVRWRARPWPSRTTSVWPASR